MSKLYLYNYNNYINRIFKKENSLADYGTPIYTLNVTNFNYNDGVDTSHVVNYNNQDGDYVIITDDEDNIQSRWFVIENVRNRGGQHNLTLKRDLKADLYDFYKDSPMIVHRAWLPSESSLLFNNEGFSFNQIKREEILLKDITRIPWYVVYFAKNAPAKTESFGFGGERVVDEVLNTPLNESIYATGNIDTFENIKYIINAQDSRYISSQHAHDTTEFGITSSGYSIRNYVRYALDNDYIWFQNDINTITGTLESAFENKYSNIHSLDTEHLNTISNTDIEKLNNINGKYVKDSLNRIYQINVSRVPNSELKYNLNSNVTDYMKNVINNTGLDREYDWGDEAFGISFEKVTYVISATIDNTNTLEWSIDFANKQKSNDSTFNVIAFPATTAYCLIPRGDSQSYPDDYFMNEEISKLFIASLLNEYGADNYIYDIQLLPYCPLSRAYWGHDEDYGEAPIMLGGESTESEGRLLNKEVYAFKPLNAQIRTECLFYYYIKDTTFTFDINKSLILDSYSTDISINRKVNNECNLYRLVSPNYNGQFEFSVAKNKGVDKFNVDVTLRPYNPYIHVNPNFKSLYGLDFDDSRGLICQGDFSIPLIKDAWVNYELQNKNYLNIFNRQIENMDFNFEQERIKGAFGAIAGGIVGGIGGGVSGYKIGGPVGAGIGAALGGIGSATGGIIDYNMLTSRQEEQRDFAIDNFKYQLGNIKALPYSITKVTPFTANNKLFPFIEKYTATEDEINILVNKLEFNSFTVEAISNLSMHLNAKPPKTNKFFSATLIRIEGANQPTHELQELARELEKGVYI